MNIKIKNLLWEGVTPLSEAVYRTALAETDEEYQEILKYAPIPKEEALKPIYFGAPNKDNVFKNKQ